jgi:signal transduction histidine kinase
METTARKLAGSVLRAQDEERRRIARELHDSTGQNLVVATLLLRKLQGSLPASGSASAAQLSELLQRSIADLRTTSYLLHPPLLDEAGLSLALRSYIEGFSARSGIDVDIDLSDSFERLPGDIELALFRVAQEALTNVSRHSDSKRAHIRIRRRQTLDGPSIVMTIENNCGAAAQAISLLVKPAPVGPAHGVGLASMRERLHQIGGHLEFLSGGGATLVRATVPLPAA